MVLFTHLHYSCTSFLVHGPIPTFSVVCGAEQQAAGPSNFVVTQV